MRTGNDNRHIYTLAYSENIQKAGFTREQADAMTKANAEAFNSMVEIQELATKNDVNAVRQELPATKHDLEIALANTKHDILKWDDDGHAGANCFACLDNRIFEITHKLGKLRKVSFV